MNRQELERKYLICAFPPGCGGVGRLLTALIPEYQEKGFDKNWPSNRLLHQARVVTKNIL